ncbi:hypothetical protein RM543_18060 [Roseicyclus sp. F158]|uniref:Aldehyde dehydrogenase family protein n=1 Tax=Tropicimonas omnivorans TaxID=3075590 RepID=A0ABU3DLI7_9RHOB|nr:hypothetical protein [Roseicyclus sp. F158]MDT0684571.1 hypothetical protein [Roseicyclus sp. F158]
MTVHPNLIAGEWVASDELAENINPSDLDDVVGQYCRATREQTEDAIATARQALPSWAESTPQRLCEKSFRRDPLDHLGASGDGDEGLRCLHAVLVIFGHPAMPPEPGEAPFDDPVQPGDPEGLLCPFDDDEPPAVAITKILVQALTLVAGVGDHRMDFRPERREACGEAARRPAIGHAGWLDPARDEKAFGIHEDLPLAALHALMAVEAANAPLSVVFTDCASMITTVGSIRRPAFSRAAR